MSEDSGWERLLPESGAEPERSDLRGEVVEVGVVVAGHAGVDEDMDGSVKDRRMEDVVRKAGQVTINMPSPSETVATHTWECHHRDRGSR